MQSIVTNLPPDFKKEPYKMINQDFDPNSISNPTFNIFGIPVTEQEARIVILPVPWEVTVSSSAGTARAPEHIFKASMQVDLYDADFKEGWRQGFFMRPADKKILLKSDYLRKEAELLIDYISKGELVEITRKDGILIKCPSKYKDDPKAAQNNLSQN